MSTSTLEQQRRRALDDAQHIIDTAKSAQRSLTSAERAQVETHLKTSERLLGELREQKDDADLRARLGAALGDEPMRLGERGRFDAKNASQLLVAQMMPDGTKTIAPSGTAVAPAGLTIPQPIPLDRPANSVLAAIDATQVPEPPTVSYMRQATRTNNAAVVASGGTKPTSLMGLVRVDTVLSVVATLSEPIDRYWLRDSSALQQWVEQELTGDVNVAIEALVFSTLAATSGVQTQSFSVDIAETMRKAETKVQLAGGTEPVALMHPNDYEALCLLRSAGPEKLYVASSTVLQNVPGGAVSPPTGAGALLSWGMPIALSIAATPGTVWVLARDALRLFVDGAVLIDWSDAEGFKTNEVTGRAETRVLPAVLRPFSVVKTTVTAGP